MQPVIEQIAELIALRLGLVIGADTVTRPLRINVEPAGDCKITLTQGAKTKNERLSCPGNPPIVAWNQIFIIAVELRPSELDSTAIDTLRNQFEAEIRRALTMDGDWYRFNGLAINAEIGAARSYSSEASAGVKVDLLVQYRHPENDAYTAA